MVIIASMFFVLLGLVTIAGILYLSRDPQKFIDDGDIALTAARQATDEELKKLEYKNATRNYLKARALAKDDELRVEMLFKLAELYIETEEWDSVRGVWTAIVKVDPKNIKARLGLLEYMYIMADTGVSQFWQGVASQASELIDVVEDKELTMEDTAKFATFTEQEKELKIGSRKRIGPYLYLLKGRAILEVAARGGLTDPDEALGRAVEDLRKNQQLDPNEVDVYLYLAQASIVQGNLFASRGNMQEKEETLKQAEELLMQAVEIAGDDSRASVSLLMTKMSFAQMDVKEKIKTFEPEYLSLAEKFNSSSDVYLALASFYQQIPEKLTEAIKAADKAMELEKESVVAAISAANLHYRYSSIYKQEDNLYKAIEIAKKALTLPNAQDKLGPRNYSNIRSRTALYIFLANCYTEQILDPIKDKTEEEKQQLVTNVEQAVHEIEQLYGSGEKPEVVKWRGILELAKGNRNIAVRKLYAAYEQLKASGREDAYLSYVLAGIFKDTTESGAVVEFLRSALSAGIALNKPEVALDYAEVLLDLNAWTAAMSNITLYEENLGVNERSQMLRIRAYIAANQFEDAEKELANLDMDNLEVLRLNLTLVRAKIRQIRRTQSQRQVVKDMGRLEVVEQMDAGFRVDDKETALKLSTYRYNAAEFVEKMLQIDPDFVTAENIAFVFNSSAVEGKIKRAESVIDKFLEHSPDNPTALYCKQALSEPDPTNIPEERRKQIQHQVFSSIDDPVAKHDGLGRFYQGNNEPNKAIDEFKKAIEMVTSDEGVIVSSVMDSIEEPTNQQRLITFNLLTLAIGQKNWKLAEQIVDIAKSKNLDNCEGNYYAARMAVASGKNEEAMMRLDECLKQRPVLSQAYMLRSRVNSALGNEHAYIEDAQKAASLNRQDGGIARLLAFSLYQRNEKLGNNVSSNQIIEARSALERAVSLNQRDVELLSFYAEYISSTEPFRALAIRQTLQTTAPTMGNAVLLGKLATEMARKETNKGRKEALFDVAASAFRQAKEMDPTEKRMLYAYAEYYRARGQEQEARQLLQGAEEQGVLWYHLLQSGQFEDSKKVLDQLYQADSNDVEVLKGLLLVTDKLFDREGVKRYSNELLLLEDNAENRLGQIQSFLWTGLVKEAESSLQSFKEKYPDNPKSFPFEAWVAMRKGQLKEAFELANKNLEVDQSNATAWRIRGNINILMSNYEEAIVDLKRSKSLLDDPTTRVILARAYLEMGRYEDAITELKGTIENPQAPMEARILLEKVYTLYGRKEPLMTLYRDTVEKYPENVFWLNRAGAFASALDNIEEAEQFFEQAWLKGKTDKQSDREESFDGYLKALLAGGKLDKVFVEAGKQVEGDFAAVAFIGMAEAKMKLNDKATAIQYCRKAADKARGNTNLESWALRRMYALLGNEEVLKLCNERLQANPDSFAANFTMYSLAKMKGEYNKAITYITKCLEVMETDNPSRFDYITAKVQLLQAAYNKTSDNTYRQGAIKEYEKLLEKMPNNSDILNNLAYMMAESDDKLPKAFEYAKRAYDLRPNDPGFLDTHAFVLYKMGKYQQAEEFILASLQNYEQYGMSASWDVYEHLGLIKEKLGSNDEALNAYKRVLEVGADQLTEIARQRITTAIERLSQ